MKKKTTKKPKNTGKKITGKAGRAIKLEFHLDASLLLSDIFEKKIKYLLWKLENHKPGAGFSLEQSVKRLKYLHISKKYPLLNAYISIDLIDEIRNWKNQRNAILKDLMDIHVSKSRLENLTTDGVKILKIFNKSVKQIKSTLNPDRPPHQQE
ncbi:MAG: hypothetical protein M0P58_03000 [Bacteroidales bacterium]|jgi:hypothetical protein|nr:hypothetical protein [Bacteroidales bacterium]